MPINYKLVLKMANDFCNFVFYRSASHLLHPIEQEAFNKNSKLKKKK